MKPGQETTKKKKKQEGLAATTQARKKGLKQSTQNPMTAWQIQTHETRAIQIAPH